MVHNFFYHIVFEFCHSIHQGVNTNEDLAHLYYQSLVWQIFKFGWDLALDSKTCPVSGRVCGSADNASANLVTFSFLVTYDRYPFVQSNCHSCGVQQS